MPSTAKSVVDVVCRQLNVLYTCHLLINAVDLRSFYIVHLADEFTTGYTVSLAVACVTLFVLLVIIHEERNAPAQPVIADSVRSRISPLLYGFWKDSLGSIQRRGE